MNVGLFKRLQTKGGCLLPSALEEKEITVLLYNQQDFPGLGLLAIASTLLLVANPCV